MKKLQWLALAAIAATAGCGADDSVSPSEDFADAWVGEFGGVGSYALSNGDSGVEQPITLIIVAVNPKQISVAASLVYGTGRGQEATAFALLTPESSDELETQYRQGTSRIAFFLTREDDAIRGSIVTSTLRIGGTWSEDQRIFEIDVTP